MSSTITTQDAPTAALEALALRWRWGRDPQEDGEPMAPPFVPEVGPIVPNRHSASAEGALLRWRETHEN